MIRATFKMADIEAYVEKQKVNTQKAILETYKFVGEMWVLEARLNGSYQDVTGNLRSSIGYVLMVDGEQYASDFEQNGTGTDGSVGVEKGSYVGEVIASEHPKGIVLVIVAGMEYAAAVEAKGREVITGTSLEMKEKLKTYLDQL